MHFKRPAFFAAPPPASTWRVERSSAAAGLRGTLSSFYGRPVVRAPRRIERPPPAAAAPRAAAADRPAAAAPRPRAAAGQRELPLNPRAKPAPATASPAPRIRAMDFLDPPSRFISKYAEREVVKLEPPKTSPAQRAALMRAREKERKKKRNRARATEQVKDAAESLREAFRITGGAAVKSAAWRAADTGAARRRERAAAAGGRRRAPEPEGLRELIRALQAAERDGGPAVPLAAFNALVEECGRRGETAHALRVYETLRTLSEEGSPGVLKVRRQPQLKPDRGTYGPLVALLCAAGHARIAASLLDRMAAEGMPPDEPLRLRVARAALRLARDAAAGPAGPAAAPAVPAAAHANLVQRQHREARERGPVGPELERAALESFLVAGEAGRGLEHAEGLADEGAPPLGPDALLCLARLAAARWGAAAGLQALGAMDAAGLRLRARAYSLLVGDLVAAGQGRAARAVLEAMRDARCTPGRDLFHALLRPCATAARVREVLAAMARAKVPMAAESFALAMGACLRDPSPDGLRQFRRLHRGLEAARVAPSPQLQALCVAYYARGGPPLAPPAGSGGEDPAEAAAEAEERRGGRPEPGGDLGPGHAALRASRLRAEAGEAAEAASDWADVLEPGAEGRKRRRRRLVLADDEVDGGNDEGETAEAASAREGLERAFAAADGAMAGGAPEPVLLALLGACAAAADPREAPPGEGAPAAWERALDCLDACRDLGVLPTARVYNAALLALSRARQFEAAMAVFAEMRAEGEPPASLVRVAPDRVTFGLLMHAAVQCGRVDAAVELFVAMEAAGVAPNGAIYALLVRGYGLAGDLASARYVFNEMKASGVRPPRVAYDALIVACLRCRRLDEAVAAVRELRGSGLPVEADARAFFRLYGSADRLAARFEAFQRVKGPALAELDGTALAALAAAARREAGDAAADALMVSLSAAGVRPNQRLLAYLAYGS